MDWKSFAIGIGTAILINLIWHFIKKGLEDKKPKIILIKHPRPFGYSQGPGVAADERYGVSILFTIRQENIEQKPFVVYDRASVEAYFENKQLVIPKPNQTLEMRLTVDNKQSGQFPNNRIVLTMNEKYKLGTLFKVSLEYTFKDKKCKTNSIEYVLE